MAWSQSFWSKVVNSNPCKTYAEGRLILSLNPFEARLLILMPSDVYKTEQFIIKSLNPFEARLLILITLLVPKVKDMRVGEKSQSFWSKVVNSNNLSLSQEERIINLSQSFWSKVVNSNSKTFHVPGKKHLGLNPFEARLLILINKGEIYDISPPMTSLNPFEARLLILIFPFGVYKLWKVKKGLNPFEARLLILMMR